MQLCRVAQALEHRAQRGAVDAVRAACGQLHVAGQLQGAKGAKGSLVGRAGGQVWKRRQASAAGGGGHWYKPIGSATERSGVA